jgi:hypothetical protein
MSEGVTTPAEEAEALAKAERDRSRRIAEISKIRAIADFLEAHPELDVPFYNTRIDYFVSDKEEMAKWATALPGKKEKIVDSSYFTLKGSIPVGGLDEWGDPVKIPVEILTSRNTVCTRVVKGTEIKKVPAPLDQQPEPVMVEKEVEIVEWVCDPILGE